jgi:lysozyme family protein
VSRIIDELIRREGGYSNRAADRGGPTNYGITQKTLSAWRGKPVSAQDVQNLTETEAREIYASEFIAKPGLDKIQDPELRELLIDCGVNHGPARAVAWLQLAIGAKPDGVLGPATLAALYEVPARAVYRHVVATRAVFYGRLINRDRKQGEFAEGWMKRLAEFIEMAGQG